MMQALLCGSALRWHVVGRAGGTEMKQGEVRVVWVCCGVLVGAQCAGVEPHSRILYYGESPHSG